MRQILPILLMIVVLIVVGMIFIPSPMQAQGYPYATPNPANVIVIPIATPESRIDQILSSPAILTPGATPFNAVVPPNFLQIGDTAIVLAQTLNVRSAPILGAGGAILGQLQRGSDLTVLQLSGDLEWALVDTRGPFFLTGWVSTRYIARQGDFQPFAPGLADSGGTGLLLKAQETVNIRSAPTLFSERVGILPKNVQAEIIGRKSTYNWWKIRVDETVGWVAAEYIYVIDAEAYQVAPIVTD